MSQEFRVRTRFRKLGKFEELANAWWQSIPVPSILQYSGDGYAWIFAPGESIRGCSIREQPRRLGSEVNVRLSVAASAADWRIAFAFLRLALERGASVKNDSEVTLRAADVTDAVAATAASKALRGDFELLRTLLNNEDPGKPIQLPNLRFTISIAADDVPHGALTDDQLEALATTLAARTARYRGARMAGVIELDRTTTVIAWPGDAILTEPVDFVLLAPEPRASKFVDYRYRPWSEVVEILGDGAALIDGQAPAYFLRGFDAESAGDRALWQKLRENAPPAEELRAK